MNNATPTDLTVTRLTATHGPAPGVAASDARRANTARDADSGSGTTFSQALDDAGNPRENQAPGGAQPTTTAAAPATPAAPQPPAAALATGNLQRPAATAAELLLASLNVLEGSAPAADSPAAAATEGSTGGDALPKDGTKLPQDPDPGAVLLALGQATPTAAGAAPTPTAIAAASSEADAAPPSGSGPGDSQGNGQGGAGSTLSPITSALAAAASATLAATLAGGAPGTTGPASGAAAGAAARGDTAATLDDDANALASLSPERDAARTDGFSRLLSAAGIFLDGAAGAGASAATATASPAFADAGTLGLAATPLLQAGGLLAAADGASPPASANAAPAPLQPLASPTAWAQSLGDRVLLLAGQGTQQATLHLQPEHLGPMQIHIQMDDGTAQVSFSAHHPETRAALADALPRLREMFTEQGLTLLQANVDAGGGRAGYPPDPTRPWGPGTRSPVELDGDRLATAARSTLWQVRPPGSRRIDLFV